jgi:hypothetical protein
VPARYLSVTIADTRHLVCRRTPPCPHVSIWRRCLLPYPGRMVMADIQGTNSGININVGIPWLDRCLRRLAWRMPYSAKLGWPGDLRVRLAASGEFRPTLPRASAGRALSGARSVLRQRAVARLGERSRLCTAPPTATGCTVQLPVVPSRPDRQPRPIAELGFGSDVLPVPSWRLPAHERHACPRHAGHLPRDRYCSYGRQHDFRYSSMLIE